MSEAKKIKCISCGTDNEIPIVPVLCRKCKADTARDLCDSCFAAGEAAGHKDERLGIKTDTEHLTNFTSKTLKGRKNEISKTKE